MAIDPTLSSLLRNLKVERSPVPPRTWDSIVTESGGVRSSDSTKKCQDSIYESSSISEAALVRLVINAMLGVKSSLMEIDMLSAELLSSAADRTFYRVPTLWCRSLSTVALGKILKCISHSGLLVFFIQRFVNFYLDCIHEINGANVDKEEESEIQGKDKISDSPTQLAGKFCDDSDLCFHPPYSLVNQSFAVAVRKVLQAYVGALSTLIGSVKLRRTKKSSSEHAHISNKSGSSTTIPDSGITVLEVFLHTKELRTCIESLANICFPRFADLALSREDLTADTKLKFHNFPRGADLLSYLYVQLRDADPGHQELLKFLFLGACEPYCAFIKSWIYRASIDDPYKEFFVYNSAWSSKAESETNDILVPCFLREVRDPLFRAGKQLEVLVKLLNLCNLAFIGGRADMTCNLANLDEVLPFWVSSDTRSIINSLNFSKQILEVLMHQRQMMYKMMLEKLKILFEKLNDRFQHLDHSVRAISLEKVSFALFYSSLAIYFGNCSSFLGKSVDPNISYYLGSEGHLFPNTNDTQEANKINTSQKDTDGSFKLDEVSSDDEPPQTSDSSSYYSEGENEPEKLCLLSENISQPQLPDISSLFSWCGTEILSVHTEKGMPSPLVPYHAIDKKQNFPMTPLTDQTNVDQNKSTNLTLYNSGNIAMVPMSKGDNSELQKCWLVEGNLKSPFNFINFKGPKQQQSTDDEIFSSNGSSEFLRNGKSLSDEVLIPLKSKLDLISKINLMDTTNGLCFFKNYHQCNPNGNYNLSANPMLTKASWLSNLDNFKIRDSMSNHRLHLPDFDFLSVSVPSMCYLDSMCNQSYSGSQFGASLHAKSDPSAVRLNKTLTSPVQDHNANQTLSDSLYSSSDSASMPEISSSSVFGGSAWVGSLQRFSEHRKSSNGDMRHDLSAEFEMPVDVVIDKCILQEILLQYKYISSFTIKLLDEGFDLHGHLMALRRYHFMELADWADSFILSIRNRKWSSIESQKRVAEIQGLLELSLQRSSCEADCYKERLFMYVKAQNHMLASACIGDLQLFDYMSLGYRVHWPISIIVTPDALKIYAEIFNYLIQVRIAATALSDIWHYMKGFMRSIPHREESRSEHVKEINVLLQLRHKICHFVSTLQHYVHSQLSGVSWCRFQYSLKHQVKDIWDLESLHMSYLAEALDICFLSDETEPVATAMKNVLQCALDFWQCVGGGHSDALRGEADSSNIKSYINFSKVFDIEAVFERNLKNLYLLYLKSPRHGEFSLCLFWNLLDYNEYCSTVFNKDLGYFYL